MILTSFADKCSTAGLRRMNVFKASFQRAADQFERTVASIGQPS